MKPQNPSARIAAPFAQADLFGAPPPLPEGFLYRPGLLSADEEEALAAELAALPFKPFDFHGWEANRQVVSSATVTIMAAAHWSKPRRSRRFSIRSGVRSRRLSTRPPTPSSRFSSTNIGRARKSAGTATSRNSARWPACRCSPLPPAVSPQVGRSVGAPLAQCRATLGLSFVRPRALDLGAQHTAARPPSLFDHPADACRPLRGEDGARGRMPRLRSRIDRSATG